MKNRTAIIIYVIAFILGMSYLSYEKGYDKAYEQRLGIINRRNYIHGFIEGVEWNHRTGSIDYWQGVNFFTIHASSNFTIWTNRLEKEWGIIK